MSTVPRPAEVVSHYRLLKPLGQGAMGEVWAAEDTQLPRKVGSSCCPATWPPIPTRCNACCAFAGAGLPERALAELKEGIRNVPSYVADWPRRDPDLASLHDHPEFIRMFGKALSLKSRRARPRVRGRSSLEGPRSSLPRGATSRHLVM